MFYAIGKNLTNHPTLEKSSLFTLYQLSNFFRLLLATKIQMQPMTTGQTCGAWGSPLWKWYDIWFSKKKL